MIDQSTITITPEAAGQLSKLIQEDGTPNLALRIYVSGGGCSGLQYGMTLDDSTAEGDEVIESSGVRMVIDSVSLPYLRGSEIDYVDSLMGAGFTVHNPNAVHSCACGHSFDTGDDASTASACGCGH